MAGLDRRELLAAVVGAGAATWTPAASAQRPPSLFRELFPRPTGRNGLEELAMARDLLRRSKAYQRAVTRSLEGPNVPLSMKRSVVADREAARALALIEQGVAKPIHLPEDAPESDGAFSVTAHLRELARFIQMPTYVHLADGRITQAIGCTELSLRMGQALHGRTVISLLVGIAIAAIGAAPLGKCLDQLGLPDCEQVSQLARNLLAGPSPLLQVLESERAHTRRTLAQILRSGADGLEGLVGPTPGFEGRTELTEAEQRTLRELRRALAAPGGFTRLTDQIEQRIEASYQRAAAEARKPLWERARPDEEKSPSLAEHLASSVSSIEIIATGCGDHYGGHQARLRLLAVHAAIRRFRWEIGRYPLTLDELGVGELAADLFTGEPLRYEPFANRYRLYSVGPPDASEGPRTMDGRRPVFLEPAAEFFGAAR